MNTIYQNLIIKANLKCVFEAVTSPDLLNQWWTTKSLGELAIGGIYSFWFSEEYDWQAKVIELDINQLVGYRMIKADQDWEGTELRFKIEIISEQTTRLHFYHIGWKEMNLHFGQTSHCWALYLNTLKDLLETNN